MYNFFSGGVGVAAMGGRIYAVGGHDGVRYLDSVEVSTCPLSNPSTIDSRRPCILRSHSQAYDPFTNEWTTVTGIKQCRAGAGVAWCDCSVDTLQRPSLAAGCCPPTTSSHLPVAYCV